VIDGERWADLAGLGLESSQNRSGDFHPIFVEAQAPAPDQQPEEKEMTDER